MHPLGWGVNYQISHAHFAWPAYLAPSSLWTDGEADKRDVSLLKTHDFAPIGTNAEIPPTNHWSQYLHNVYFHVGTSTAYINLGSDAQPLTAPAVESLRAALDYVAELNGDNGCIDNSEKGEPTTTLSSTTLNSQCAATLSTSTCWSPIVFYTDRNENQYEACLQAAIDHEHPPLVFYGKRNNDRNATLVNHGSTVVFHMGDDDDMVTQLRIEVGGYQTLDEHNNLGDAKRQRNIKSMSFEETNLKNLPLELKDEAYVKDLTYLRTLADEALANDPVVGSSKEMPMTRMDEWRMCMGGECPLGNLFTDAIRWSTNADFAVLASGGLRGPGWPAGNVTVGDLWAALPFINQLCTGVMSGVSIYRLLNYSTAVSAFESTYTPMGDRLLQVSGMRMTYNTLASSGRLMAVEVYDKETKSYQPIERLKLYKFVTDDWMCKSFHPYPSFFGSELQIKGEVAGVVDGDENLQSIVERYLAGLDQAYDTKNQGRLVNDTEAFEPLNFIQTADSCASDHDWDEELATCFPKSRTGQYLFALGVTFFSLQACATTSAVSWTAWNRNSAVVIASQPEFLSLVAIGSLLLASAILPLSIEGKYMLEPDAEEAVVACMAVPWLLGIVSEECLTKLKASSLLAN